MVTEENEKFFDIFSNAIIKQKINLNYKLLFTKDVEQFLTA